MEHTKPKQKYWHVWTDDDGRSRQEQYELSDYQKESMGGDSDEQWNNELQSGDVEIVFAVLPVGFQGNWHENPKPQWIIPLSGKWFVETMDGTRAEMGPGEVSFGGDQGTKEDEQGRKGHLSGTIGNEPAHLMMIQLKDKKWKGARPEDFE